MKSIKNPGRNNLIIMEGLTGLGKSTLAHFIARQLQYHDVEATWVHEGELGHPLSVEVDSGDINLFMQAALAKWQGSVSRNEGSDEITILEGCFFNNLFETLFSHNVPIPKICQYSDVLQDIIKPLQPALIYLTHRDVSKALADNFRSRGPGFQDFVIKLTTTTPYAQHRELTGYEGMIEFWDDFVALTDQLYTRFRFQKIALENSAGNWESLNQQVLDFLSIPYIVEKQLSEDAAADLTGTYKDQRNGREFDIRYRNHNLFANLFLDGWTRLIPETDGSFIAEGWHFIVHFDKDNSGKMSAMRIDGQDVDYLSLVGTVAERVSD
jgi:hypothetical protein